MISIGDPSKRTESGQRSDIIFYKGNHKAITVFSSCLVNFNIKDEVVGISYGMLELKHNEWAPFFIISNCDYFEFIHYNESDRATSLGFFRIDYVEGEESIKGDQDHKMKIQARGLASPLIDRGFDDFHEGTLKSLMNKFSSASGVKIDTVFDERIIKFSISSGSMYGIIRLLGRSLGFVTNFERDGCFSVVSNPEALRRFLTKPVHKMSKEDLIGNFKMHKGIEIKDQ